MTICKCKGCKEIIITTAHVDKKNTFCLSCLIKSFKESKVDGYVICLKCGVAVIPEI